MTVDDFEPGPHLVSSMGVPSCSAVTPSTEATRFDPAWRTSTVLAIAEGIVRDVTFDVMPILADALEDAGCDNQPMLNHCRHGTKHSKMCWVLPLVMEGARPLPLSRTPIDAEVAFFGSYEGFTEWDAAQAVRLKLAVLLRSILLAALLALPFDQLGAIPDEGSGSFIALTFLFTMLIMAITVERLFRRHVRHMSVRHEEARAAQQAHENAPR